MSHLDPNTESTPVDDLTSRFNPSLESQTTPEKSVSSSTVYTPQLPTTLSTTIQSLCDKGIDESSGTPSHVALKLPPCELPKFNGQNFELFLDKFSRFVRLSGLQSASDAVKCDWLIQAADPSLYGMFTMVCRDAHNDLNIAL